MKTSDSATIDRAFSFVFAYPTEVVSEILKKFEPGRKAVILDPFVGTGTTLLECKRRGFASIGVEANPFCAMGANAKLNWDIKPGQALQELTVVLEAAERKYGRFLMWRKHRIRTRECGKPISWPTFSQMRQGAYLIESGLLSRGWISPLTALKVLILIREIEQIHEPGIRNLLLISLLGLLVPEFANVGYGPEIYRKGTRRSPEVFRRFKERATALIASVKRHKSEYLGPPAKVVLGNSLNGGLARIRRNSVTHVITSPPYPAEHDYTRSTRLELAFGGFASSVADLQKIKRNMVPSSSKSSYVDQRFFEHVRHLRYLRQLRNAIHEKSLGRDHGFAKVYPRLVGDYFGAMYLHFRSLKRILRPGGRCAYVVGDQASFFGVHIRTAKLLARMLREPELGFEVEGMDLLRNRRVRGGKRILPEIILYFRKPKTR